MTDSGLQRGTESSADPVAEPAHRLIARLADEQRGLQVLALGPLTELAATLLEKPRSYARLAGIVAMTGVVTGASQEEGVGEWNAAADPDALAEVLDGPVPVRIVPHEVVPVGPPEGKRAPVVGPLGTLTAYPTPRFWDLATAGFFTDPEVASLTTGAWTVDLSDDPGRLVRTGHGDDVVVTALDAEALDAAYAEVFAAE